jgi:hypothetical protein
MRIFSRSWQPQILALVMILSLGLRARAESPREELVHAFYLLKTANHDYGGHRKLAMAEVEAAGRGLGLELGGDLPERERQWQSDARLAEARRLLRHAREKLEKRDRDRVADRVEKAIREIDAALRAPVAPVVLAESPREELIHAFHLLKTANHDYGGHRRAAMAEVEAAGRGLGLELGGDVPDRERQWQSDARLAEARRLLLDAREKLELRDRDRVAARVEKAIREIDAALAVR